MSNRKFFVICSFGQSGTRWLTNSLNMHPSIKVAHGQSVVESKSIGSGPRDSELDPEVLKTRMFANSSHEVCGVIHRHYTKNLYPYIQSKSLNSQPLTAIRHPISRLISQFNSYNSVYINSGNTFVGFDHIMATNKIAFEEKCSQFQIDPSDIHNQIFFATTITLNLHFEEIFYTLFYFNQGIETLIPMERFTTDPEYFTWIIDWVSNGSLSADHSYLNQVFSNDNKPKAGNNLSHALDQGQSTAFSVDEKFQQLEEWQQQTIRDALNPSTSRLTQLCKKLGYSFTVLN